MSGQRFYSDEEANEILKLASQQGHSESGMSRDSLLQAAAELGISATDLAAAERQVIEQRQSKNDLAEFDRFQRSEFFEHLMTYLILNGFMVGINFFTAGHRISWALFVILGWGIGIAFDAYGTFARSSASYRDDFENWKRRRDKRAKKAAEKASGTYDAVLDGLILQGATTKIDAIKALREQSDLSLAESKAAVEEYLARKPGALM